MGWWRDEWMSGHVRAVPHMCAASVGESLLLCWCSGGGPAVLPPLVVVVCRKNRRKCNFFIFLPFFDSSRPSMATSSILQRLQCLEATVDFLSSSRKCAQK